MDLETTEPVLLALEWQTGELFQENPRETRCVTTISKSRDHVYSPVEEISAKFRLKMKQTSGTKGYARPGNNSD